MPSFYYVYINMYIYDIINSKVLMKYFIYCDKVYI